MKHHRDDSTIAPHHFFSRHSEKTKFNWFAFELACELERAIPRSTKRYLANHGYAAAELNRACVKLAMLLQGVILRTLERGATGMEISHVEVEKAFPGLRDKTINELVNSAGAAWDHLLSICVSCPTACITNRDEPCAMFDEEPETAAGATDTRSCFEG